jgi:trk system potassium uptake protein TrkA
LPHIERPAPLLKKKGWLQANNIFRYVRQADIINIAGIHGLDAEVIEIHVSENAKATKVPIGEMQLPKDATIGGIIRNNGAWIAEPDFQIMANDKVVIFALPSCIKKTLEHFS